MKPNKPLREIIIVVSVFIILWVLSFLLAGPLLGNSSLDINMHDTYTVVQSMWLTSIFPAFLWLITIGYLIRARINGFKDRTQNLILLISCGALNIFMLYGLVETARFSGFHQHIYSFKSPISNLSDHLKKTDRQPYTDIVEPLFVIQIILIFLLSIIAAVTAKNWRSTKNVH